MRQNKRTIVILIIFVILLMAITLGASHREKMRLRAGEEKIRNLQRQTEQEEARSEEIRKNEEYMQSDEYIEQIAKDKLGLIRDGDIIFKETDKAGNTADPDSGESP